MRQGFLKEAVLLAKSCLQNFVFSEALELVESLSGRIEQIDIRVNQKLHQREKAVGEILAQNGWLRNELDAIRFAAKNIDDLSNMRFKLNALEERYKTLHDKMPARRFNAKEVLDRVEALHKRLDATQKDLANLRSQTRTDAPSVE